MSPKISVVMPVWNGARFLRAALDSIFAQTFSDFELILIDDGSTDETSAILESYEDARLKVHRLAHEGIVVALNRGLAVAEGEWIARHDSDDVSEPNRLARQWEAVRMIRDAVLSYTDVVLVGEGAGEMRKAHFPRSKALLALRLCFQCPIVHSSVLFHRKACLRAGGYLAEERHAEDYALWGRMLELGEFVPLPEKLLQFRLHEQSVSQSNLQVQEELAKRIALEHCQRFLNLTSSDAERAYRVLVSGERGKDWWWLLWHCAPRLRWKSAEAYAWLCSQTLRRLAPGM